MEVDCYSLTEFNGVAFFTMTTTYTGTLYAAATPGTAGVTSLSSSGTRGMECESFDSTDAMLAQNTSTGLALYALSSGGDAINCVAGVNHSAIYALNNGGGVAVAVNAHSNNTDAGYGTVNALNTSSGYSVRGESTYGTGVYGKRYSCGVSGESSITGVFASGDNYGTYAMSPLYAVFGESAYYAGYFYGNVIITGTLYVSGAITKPGGGFLIDHPLDPMNQTLEHSFVESPDRKNVYDGVAVADAAGEISVHLPAYVAALNENFRYQLTSVGSAPDLHVSREFSDDSFGIAGAKPGQRIFWQLTGIRKDPWALATPIAVEASKPEKERGYYLQPEAYGQPRDRAVETVRHPKPTAPRSEPASPPKPEV